VQYKLDEDDWDIRDGLTTEQREAGDYSEWVDCAERKIQDFIYRDRVQELLGYEEIAEAWAIIENQLPTYNKFVELKNQYESKIFQAIFDMKLKATLSRPNSKDVMKFIPQTREAVSELLKDKQWVENLGLEIKLKILIYREDFHEWLINSEQLPLVEGCLLNK
jgi:hypothetical protein